MKFFYLVWSNLKRKKLRTSLTLLSIWGVGNTMVIFLAAIIDVPRHLMESAQLDGAGITAQSISASATVALEKVGDGFSVTTSHLEVTIKAPGADRAKIQTAADNAKAGCPISKLLNATITMEAKIEV